MRTDKSLKKDYVDSALWEQESITGKSGGEVDRYKLPDSRKARLSLSGSESNSLFGYSENGNFVDISGLSGLDSDSDSRCVAIFDYDRDGSKDILVTNTNDSTLNIYRNQHVAKDNNGLPDFVAVRLVGGNGRAERSDKFSNRDAIGSRIIVHHFPLKSGPTKSVVEFRCGEGLATQDGATRIVAFSGIEKNPGVTSQPDWMELVFPSGIRRKVENVASGKLLTIYEDVSMSDDGSGIEISDYQRVVLPQLVQRVEESKALPKGLKLEASEAPLRIVLAMATWCEKCKSKIDEVAWLQKQFGKQLDVIAVPVDLKDSQQALDEYMVKYKPIYKLLKKDLMRSIEMLDLAKSEFGDGAIPHSFVLSHDNKILASMRGLPTVSELRKLAAKHGIKF